MQRDNDPEIRTGVAIGLVVSLLLIAISYTVYHNYTLKEEKVIFEDRLKQERDEKRREEVRRRIDSLLEDRKITVKEGENIWDIFIEINKFSPTWNQIMTIAEKNNLEFRIDGDRIVIIIQPDQKIDIEYKASD